MVVVARSVLLRATAVDVRGSGNGLVLGLLVDVRLPDGSGLDVLSHIELWRSRPVTLFVTAATAVTDRIQALDRGADDYVLKPFSVDELVARVDALLRRRA